MSVIAISRGSLSAATRIAEGVGARLGSKITDREQVLAAAERYGIGETGLDMQQILTRHSPGYWDQYGNARRHYLACFKAALLDLVLAGPLVYHGNLAHALLQDVPFVLRVRVNAPMENRVETMMAELGLSRYDTIRRIEAIDNERKRWTEFLYNVDIMNASQYDVVLNLSRVSVSDGIEMVVAAVRKDAFLPTSEGIKRVRDLHLATAAEIRLMQHRDTYGLPVTVAADSAQGAVTVRLALEGGDAGVLEREIRAAIEGLEGVRRLDVRVRVQ